MKRAKRFLAIGGSNHGSFITNDEALVDNYFAFNKACDNLIIYPLHKKSGYHHNHTRVFIHKDLIPHVILD